MSATAHRRVITFHRWLGLLIALQLIVSACGGLYWATRDHKETKGLNRRRVVVAAPIPLDGVMPLTALVQGSGGGIQKARLFRRSSKVLWELSRGGKTERVDAATGEPVGPLTEAEAMAIVAAEYDGPGKIASASLIEKDPPADWMARPLPVWRVDVADAFGTRVYVDPGTGETGNNWFTNGEGWWGWFFVLHTMDWDGGPLEVNPLLAAFAIGVIALAVSGLSLWVFRLASRWRSRQIAASR